MLSSIHFIILYLYLSLLSLFSVCENQKVLCVGLSIHGFCILTSNFSSNKLITNYPLNIFDPFVKLDYMCVSITGFSILFKWSVCLSYYQWHFYSVLVNIILSQNLKFCTGSLSLFSSLSAVFLLKVFYVSYNLLE